MKRPSVILSVATFGILFSVGYLAAQEPEIYHVTEADFVEEKAYSPYAGRAYPDEVFFGDTHLHTELSFDAGLIGTSLDSHAAFRMARGRR